MSKKSKGGTIYRKPETGIGNLAKLLVRTALLVFFGLVAPQELFAQQKCLETTTNPTDGGTKGNPFLITELCQLQNISTSPRAHYRLMMDIDAAATKEWDIVSGIARGFSPI